MGFFEHRCQEFRLVFDPFHPEVSREAWVLWIQIIVVRNNSTIAIATEAKGLPNFSSGKPSTVLERAVAAAPDIICIPISRPPADHIRGRGGALWLALACAASAIDGLNLRL